MGDVLNGFYLTILSIVMKAVALLQKPNLDDSESVRDWVRKSLDVTGDIAKLIPGTADDLLVIAFRNTVEDDDRWPDFYEAISEAVGVESVDTELLCSDVRLSVSLVDPQIDPATIALIIQAIIEALKWWRNRNS